MVRHVSLPIGASVFALGPEAGGERRPAGYNPPVSERERVADELRRVREAVRERALARRTARRTLPAHRAVRTARADARPMPAAPPRRCRRRGRTTPTSTQLWRCAAALDQGGLAAPGSPGAGPPAGPARRRARRPSTRGRCSSTTSCSPTSTPASQATHRHYDRDPRHPRPAHGRDRRAPPDPAGGAGRPRARPGEADRPRARRVGARAARPGVRAAGPARAPGALEERLARAKGPGPRADEDRPRLRRAGPVHHRRGRDPGLRAARRTSSAAASAWTWSNVPFKWYPVSELVRQALAWRLLDVTESNGHARRPRDPHQVPELPRAPPAQGGLAVPPAPRGLRPLRHPYCSFTDSAGGPAGAGGHPDHGRPPPSASAARSSRSRGTWPTAWTATTACPARRCTRRPHHLGRYRDDGYGDYLFYAGRLDRLKRLDLAIDAMQRVHERGAAEDRGHGAAGRGAAQADRGTGRRRPRRAAGLRLRGGPARALRRLPRRLLRARSTRTTAT